MAYGFTTAPPTQQPLGIHRYGGEPPAGASVDWPTVAGRMGVEAICRSPVTAINSHPSPSDAATDKANMAPPLHPSDGSRYGLLLERYITGRRSTLIRGRPTHG